MGAAPTFLCVTKTFNFRHQNFTPNRLFRRGGEKNLPSQIMTKVQANSQPVSDRQFALLFAGFVLLALIFAGGDITSARSDKREHSRAQKTEVTHAVLEPHSNLAQK